MKNYLLKAIWLMALVLATLTIEANDYLKIYFKDGHTERHYMKLVESISASKYDLEGNPHEDYQVQQIVMKDTTYSYYIADIDSMSFTKVDEEQLKNEIDNVITNIAPLFNQSSNIEEMETHVNEIKKIEGVEDVWREGLDIVVKIKDWHSLYISYPLVPQKARSRLKEIDKTLDSIRETLHAQVTEDVKPLKVAIAFQMVDDIRFAEELEEMKSLKRKFASMGFDVHFIPDEDTGEIFDIDFYHRRMFDYNIVIVDTHGSCIKGKHGLLTGERVLWENLYYALKEETHDMEEIGFGYCKLKDKNDLLPDWACFVRVSEDYIKRSVYRFEDNGPHIVFIGACETFKGNDTLIREHNGIKEERKGSSAVADILFNKGADVVMGYNNLTCTSSWAASSFFGSMLIGASQETAFTRLNDGYKDEDSEYKAALIDLINPNSKYDNPKSLFLFKTHTVEKTNQEFNNEYKANERIELKGFTYIYDMSDRIPCGFRLAKRSNVDTLEEYQYEEKWADDLCHSGAENDGRSEYSVEINPYPGTKIYYRAFTYDGIHYNWGEERFFEIDKAKNHVVGDVFTVDGVAYKVTSISPLEVQIGSGMQYIPAIDQSTSGAFEVPSTVKGTDGNIYSVTSIGENAFMWCKGLISIYIGNNVKSIGDYAFCYCDGLKSIIIPNSVTSIGEGAFYGSKGITSVTIPNSVTFIGDKTFFECDNLKSIVIPNSVTYIGEETFRGCESLTTVTIGNKVTSIGKGAFQECTGLTTVGLGNSVTSIGDFAFYGCNSLTSVNIPSSVTTIGFFAFLNCGSLTSIKIPKSVTSIGDGAFRYCSSLAKIYADATTPLEVDYWLFEGVDVDNCVLYVPKGCVENYRRNSEWSQFKIIVEMN